MLRSLSTGVTGLRANQAALDVIGNNVANINTAGYKAARTTFADLISQTISGEQAPSANTGGKDPIQIGLGTGLAAIRTIFSQGVVKGTDQQTDIAIQGDGMFMLDGSGTTYYTRSGSFTLDAQGVLVDAATGYRVQGATGDITIAPGSTIPGSATTSTTFGGNLDASVADATTQVATFTVNDSLGVPHSLTLTFTKAFGTATGRWNYTITEADANMGITAPSDTGYVTFGTNGALTNVNGVAGATTATLNLTYTAAAGGATPQAVTLDFGAASTPMTGYAGTSTASMRAQNGYAAGSLRSFTIGSDGSVVGSYTNGRTATIGQLQLASFANPGGLIREGQNLFRASQNSGAAQVGNPGTGGRGTLIAGALEGANVDLAREFTELITAQRGFEVSAKIIRAGDEVLQTVVNIKQ